MNIDLHRHAVVEASAGTGKTHTIERLVLRLLTEPDVRLDQILVVTFTEKATGELKGRLRAALEKELAGASVARPQLQRALDDFDQANVFTLHGFCHRVLQEYAQEQGHDGRARLVNDKDLIAQTLREVQRRIWRRDYGANLREVLELADYDRQEASRWEKRVTELVEKLRPECGDRLAPAMLPDWPTLLCTLKKRIAQAQAQLREFFTAYPALDGLDFLRETVEEIDYLERPLKAFHDLIVNQLTQSDKNFETKGFPCLLPKNLHGPTRDAAISILALFEEIRQAADWAVFPQQLAVRTVFDILDMLRDHKRQHGLQSFQDMILSVDRGLDPEHNPRAADLSGKLRTRFRYGIVDEFQDTDPLQWRILRRLFLEGGTSKLFVVGDPKQAIFGFRGADLPTYLQATRDMLEKHDAADSPLRVNWRSTPEMLAALNRVFADGGWFDDTGIRYLPVEAAPADIRPARIVEDATERPALTVLDWRSNENLTKLRRRHSRFIVAEISRLLGGPGGKPLLTFAVKNRTKALDAGDIGILIFRRSEADTLVAELEAANIPFSFYKQTGLWQSEEAIQLRFVLKALAQPEHRPAFRQALMTQFFCLPPEELALYEDLPAQHPARRLFDKWLDLAGGRKWAALFQSMLEESGLCFRAATAGDRCRANYAHLTTFLTHEAYRNNLDLLGVVALFGRRDPQFDNDFQPRETDRPRVQIMTVHASKGLEFPVVFLAGGWTSVPVSGLPIARDEENRLVYDLSAGDREAARSEKLEEDRRLLYVALTRAMFKLYVPLPLETAKAYRSKGPLVQILSPAFHRCDWQQVQPPVGTLLKVDGAARAVPMVREEQQAPTWKFDGPLLPTVSANLAQRGIVVRSFSSLHRAAQRELDKASFAEDPFRVEEEGPLPESQEEPLRGTVFGNLVHAILEEIDFAAVGQAGSPEELWRPGTNPAQVLTAEIDRHLPRIASRLPREELLALARVQVSRLVWAALNTPLAELGCRLSDVPPEDRLAEIEFHFPEEEGETPPEEVRLEEGFLTGFMDLVVRRRGRYYLVDWKSNLLPAYGPDELRKAMDASDYHRQYRLYLQALARWLRRTLGPAFDPKRHLGGVYYLFVRGLNGRDEANGVFFHRPTLHDLRLEVVLQ